MKLTLALFIGSLEGGGAERQLVLLAKELAGRGYTVEVWVYRRGGQYEAHLLDSPHLAIVQLCGEKVGPLRRYLAVRRQVRRGNFDVLYPFLEECCLYTSLSLPRTSSAKLIWGIRNSGLNHRDYNWKVALLMRASRRLAAKADLLVFNSEAGTAQYKAANNRKRMIIHNGIDTVRFRIVLDESEEISLRLKYGLPLEKQLVLFVGRNDPMKGLPDLGAVIEKVLEVSADCHFVVVGLSREDLGREFAENDRVSVLGRISSPEELMRISEILISTSRYGEGFPNVVAEAMSSGCRIVATDVGEASRIIGNQGILCQPRDISGLVAGLIQLLATPSSRNDRIQRHELINERFGVEQMVRKTDDLICSLVEEK